MSRPWPALLLLAAGLVACIPVDSNDDDDDDGGNEGGGWDLGDGDGGFGDGGSGDGGSGDGGSGDGGSGDGGSGDGGSGDGGSGDGGSGDGGSGDGGSGDGGSGDGGSGDGGSGDGGSTTSFCNAYAPFEVSGDTLRVYTTYSFDGGIYTENMRTSSWNSSTGEAVVRRSMTSSSAAWTVEEDWTCSGGVVTMSGYDFTSASSGTYTVAFSEHVTRLLRDDRMVDGARWSETYTASTSSWGALWTFDVDFEVLGEETIETTAGEFDTIVLEGSYTFTDNVGYIGNRTGVVTSWHAPGLGLVHSQDERSDGVIIESRTLSRYGDYDPFSPDDVD